MIKPIMKVIHIINTRFLEVVSIVPMPSPISIIDISAPSEKKPMPIISMTAPHANRSIVPIGIGVIVMLNKNTIQVIGNTEVNASLIFSFSFVIDSPLFSFSIHLIVLF